MERRYYNGEYKLSLNLLEPNTANIPRGVDTSKIVQNLEKIQNINLRSILGEENNSHESFASY